MCFVVSIIFYGFNLLLTGATGYIAKGLLPVLLAANHSVYCSVHDKGRFGLTRFENPDTAVTEVDFLKGEILQNIPADIDIACCLEHAKSTSHEDFEKMESAAALNCKNRMTHTAVKQVI